MVARKSVAHDELIATIVANGDGIVRDATLFDVYEPKAPGSDIGADERSLAVRIELRSGAEPLTDERIDGTVAAVLLALGSPARRSPAQAIGRVQENMASDDLPGDRALMPTLVTPTLTKAELAELLFERLGLNKRESKDMVEAFFGLIEATAALGRRREDVGLRQFQHPAQGAAARPQPAHRRGDSDQGAPCRDFSRESQTEGSRAGRHAAVRRLRVKSSFIS